MRFKQNKQQIVFKMFDCLNYWTIKYNMYNNIIVYSKNLVFNKMDIFTTILLTR